MFLTLEPSLNSNKICNLRAQGQQRILRTNVLYQLSRNNNISSDCYMITREKGTKKNIYYLNTNNVKRLLQELISIRNAYKMVFFGRGWSPSQPFLSGHAMKGGGALRD